MVSGRVLEKLGLVLFIAAYPSEDKGQTAQTIISIREHSAYDLQNPFRGHLLKLKE